MYLRLAFQILTAEKNESAIYLILLLLLMLPDLFPRMGAWREIKQSQKSDNSPDPGPKIVKRQRVAKEREAPSIRSWTVKNEMRDNLGRMFAGAA